MSKAPMQPAIQQFTHVRDLSRHYDAFIVDLWGVIHDGIESYPGVHECLEELKKAGKKVIFLSNAPRRSVKAVEGLTRLNVEPGLYDQVITSGEVTYEHLKAGNVPLFPIKGKQYLYIGPDKDRDILDGLDYEVTEDAGNAHFALTTGFDKDASTIEEKLSQLEAAITHNLPLICANPDMVVVRHSGAHALCAGVIAEKYLAMGGVVQYFGKPYAEVYTKSMQAMGDFPKHRIAMIGDSLTTDIKGGNDVGIDSYLIPGGILGKNLGIKHGELPEPKAFAELCRQYGITPTGLLAALVW